MVERNLIRERTSAGLVPPRPGPCGGRPVAVNDDILTSARARRERGEPVTAIARHPGAGRSAFCRAMILSATAARLLTARDTTR